MKPVALLAGAALGLLSAEPVRRLGGRRGVIGAGAGLVTAAVIYPAARRDRGPSGALAVEAGVVLATTALAAVAAGGSPATGRRLLALGWATHAIFDYAQGPSADSRLPAWYPDLCAGYDVAFAARIAG
ncbi:hypothetical protein EFK50_00485 [Nocardioides marmoriginsengisoli]|uniref:Uncharacterized protein n=1 Tax=Nocardioides marmoriginsengisoli TaxID=661483 RepID=A0A3N0CRN3_9ACTN|nr:hypothetical protein [Nocardioides marmoriginsengisoli]RNL66142.1 hypothetical protein EFK50_00485 [Nocardioides marmoriginsengisoli]